MSKHHQRDLWGGDTSSSRGQFKRCYESHPPLILGDGIKIYGGSCSSPIIHDADIYVGFDLSMQKSNKAYPWEPGESFLYYIKDMQAPSDADSFKKLIDWLAVQLTAKKKVHVGCIGGHGRTGTVLAALAHVMTGRKDAIEWVREQYCQKAVESHSQVDFLVKLYGMEAAVPAKAKHSNVAPLHYPARNSYPAPQTKIEKPKPMAERDSLPKATHTANPAQHRMAIWGDAVKWAV
jgi:hypothetical protein